MVVQGLSVYASKPETSRGRCRTEPDAPTRNAFQRDRDRIVHSTAFRRLVYKTQVFLNHEGDLFRTRLTHSLEVAQIARSIARRLGLHEDLVEAISLAHDIGHTPFGHAGQDALQDALTTRDPNSHGFEHNLQSLRVVDHLEQRYPEHDGLNLCFETREGILKHCSRRNALRLEQVEPGGVGARFLARTQPSLEAQLCNLADEIAYNTHDIDDGVRSGLLSLEQLRGIAPFATSFESTLRDHPHINERRLLFEATRRMLSEMVYDLIDETALRLSRHAPCSADEARQQPAMVAFSDEMANQIAGLKHFLHGQLYRHPQVMDNTGKAKLVLRDLFHCYFEDTTFPTTEPSCPARRPRVIADYIAGMTDRFALREHRRLTGQCLLD